MALTIDIEDRAGTSVVRLQGELTDRSGQDLVNAAKRLLEKDGARMIIDLGQVSFMGSSGLGDLVRLTAQANSQGARIILANLTPFVSGLLNTTRLEKFFEVCPDVDAALARLK
jgi:anti-sigma B factor antagonist